MSAPGAGEGISWVDVAASAAGIYRQMEQIGREAATGFTNQFNTAVSPALSAALNQSMGAAVRSASAQISGLRSTFAAALGGQEAGAAGTAAGRMWAQGFSAQAMQVGRDLQAMSNDARQQFSQMAAAAQQVGAHMRRADWGGSDAGRRAGEEFARSFLPSIQQRIGPLMQSGRLFDFRAREAGEQSGEEFGGGFQGRLRDFLGQQRFDEMASQWSTQFGHMGSEAAQSSLLQMRQTFTQGLADFRVDQSALRFDQMLPNMTQQFGQLGMQTAQAFNNAFRSRVALGPALTDIMGIAANFLPGFERLFKLLTDESKKAEDAMARSATNIRDLPNVAESAAQKLGRITQEMGGKVFEHVKFPGLVEGAEAQGAEAGAAAGKKWADALRLPMIDAAIAVGAEVVSVMKHSFELINKETEAFGGLFKSAAETAMGTFESVVAGKVPDFQAAFGLLAQGAKVSMEAPLNMINVGIDSTVGHIPVIGQAFKAVASEAQEAINTVFEGIETYTSIAGQFGKVLMDIGNDWQETGRVIAGQTLGTEHLEGYLEIVRDIASSGDLVHFKDVANVVGELSQRLSGLDNGAGLTREQLTELATTLAEGNELLGDTKINVDNLTSAFNSFDVPAEQTNQLLTEFVNIARMTGADINELTRDLDLMSPALQSAGLSAQDSALMMGLLNEELGKPALGRFSFAFSHLVEQVNKSGLSWEQFVGVIQSYNLHTKEGEDAAVRQVENLGAGAKAAENFVHMIKEGIIPTHEAMVEAFNKHGRELTEPFEQALEVTKKFEDSMEQLSNQVRAALAPLGVELVEKLNGVGDQVSNWLQTHQVEFIGWVGAIGEKLLEWGGKISHFMATMMRDMSGTVEYLKDSIVLSVMLVDAAFQKMTAGFMALPANLDPTGITGAMQGIHKATTDALPALGKMYSFDLAKVFNEGADAADTLGYKMEGLEGPLANVVGHSQDAAKFWAAFRTEYSKTPGEAAKLQDALAGVGDAMMIGGDKTDPAERAKAIKAVTDQLAQGGVRVDVDQATGKIKGFAANTQEELDKLVEYLNSRFGPDEFAKISQNAKITFKVEPAPGEDVHTWLQNHIGLPSELANSFSGDGLHLKIHMDMEDVPPELRGLLSGPGVEGGPPAATGRPSGGGEPWWKRLLESMPGSGLSVSAGLLGLYQSGGTVLGGTGSPDDAPALLTRGEKVMTVAANQQFGPILDAMNAGAGLGMYQAGGDVGALAGIPASMQGGTLAGTGITLPAGIAVVTPQPMGESDTMTRAGIPDKFQGDVVVGGVTSPGVAFPTAMDVKDGEKKGASEVMDSMGIPSSFQGDNGLDVPVKLSLQPGETLPGSADTGSPGSPSGPGPGGPVQDQVRQAMLFGGFAMAAGGALGAGPLHGGATTSLSYHSPSHLAPHTGLPGSSATYWKGMLEGGFPESEFGPLSNLIQGESSWNPDNVNPSSGAFGLFQFLGHENDKYGQMGGYSHNPYQQAKAGIQYIKDRYGTPTNAYNTWNSRSPHWYQSGGQVGTGKDLLAGFFKGLLGELGFTMPDTHSGELGHQGFWDQLMHPQGYNDGGHIKGNYWPMRDSVPMNVPPGTFIMNRNSSQNYADIIDHILGVGPQGSFAAGGMIPIIAQPGERVIPPGAAPAALLHAMNQGTLVRRQGGGQTGVLQVIYNPPGTQEYYGEAKPYGLVGPGTGQPQYYNADWGGHHGHVHTSFETGPNGEPYGVPIGSELHDPAMSGFPEWVRQLGAQYGVFGTTYHGHQEHGGKNHGIDWWPAGASQDMSGLSYTPEQTGRLRTFASRMRSIGAGSGAAWGSGSYSYAGASGSSSYGGSGSGSYALSPAGAALRAALKRVLPPWLSSALGMQGGGPAGGPVPSPWGGPMGGDGPDDGGGGDDQRKPRIILVDTHHGGGDPNQPRTPEPVGPFDPSKMPTQPWVEKLRVAPGTPGGVSTPYGTFMLPWDVPNYAGLSQEEVHAIGEWLLDQKHKAERSGKDADAAHDAALDEQAAMARLQAAQGAYDIALGKMPAGVDKQTWIQLQLSNKQSELYLANDELVKARAHEKETSGHVTTSQQALSDANDQAALDATKMPPWMSKAKGTTPDEGAAAMGSGLIKGMAQELGFGDVFGKPPWEWGIWKLFAGGASFALNLANMVGEAGGAKGFGSAPGATALFGGQTGPAPGAAPGVPPPAAPGAGDQPVGTTQEGLPIYMGAKGEQDVPDALGEYTYPHGAVGWGGWTYNKETKRYKPPGQGGAAPPAAQPAQGGGGGDTSFLPDPTKLGGTGWFPVGGGQFELMKGTTHTGRKFGTDGKEIGGGGGPAAAGPPNFMSPAAPGSPFPKAGTNVPGAGTSPGPGMHWEMHDKEPVAVPDQPRGGGQAGPAGPMGAGEDLFGGGGGGWGGAGAGSIGGAGGILDWAMHPASLAIRQARAEGRLGPPPAANIAGGMAASQRPANQPAFSGVSSGGGSTLNVINNMSGLTDPTHFAPAVQTAVNTGIRAGMMFGGAPVL